MPTIFNNFEKDFDKLYNGLKSEIITLINKSGENGIFITEGKCDVLFGVFLDYYNGTREGIIQAVATDGNEIYFLHGYEDEVTYENCIALFNKEKEEGWNLWDNNEGMGFNQLYNFLVFSEIY